MSWRPLDKPQQRPLAVLAVLILVCVGIYARTWRPRPAVASRAPVTPLADPARGGEAAGDTLPGPGGVEPPVGDRTAQQQRAELLAWGRDPFLAGQSQATGDVALSGILWDAAHPIAIINGSTVSVGDAVDGFQVLDIQPDHVTLTDGATRFDVRINP